MKAKRCTTHSKIQCSHKESATLSPTPQLSSYFDEYTISQFSWTSFHKTQEELERLRHIGDDVCDNAVAFIEKWKAQEPCQPRDTLDAMFQYLETGKLSKGVESSTAPSAAIVDNFLTKTIPHWVCFAQVERGQHVFWKYSTPHLLDLLFALVGGLGAPVRFNSSPAA